MNISFTKKYIVVTGGTRGIGRSIAVSFLNSGARVLVTGRSPERPKDLETELDYFYLDLTSKASIDAFLIHLSSLNKIDAFVNNAGINLINDVESISDEDFDAVMDINLKGPFLISRHITRLMKSHESGRVVNIGSIWSEITKKGRVSYITAKSGLAGLSRGLSTDLSEYNILVNTVSPGFVETTLTKQSLSKDQISQITQDIPLKRLAQPYEIANLVVFLCSDLNTYITGQNIIIDGGYSNV